MVRYINNIIHVGNILSTGADHLIRGGGTIVFLIDQTFFDSKQIFSGFITSKQFFSQQSNTKQFFHHLIHLILRTPEVPPHLPGLSTVIFDKESYCVEYVEQSC